MNRSSLIHLIFRPGQTARPMPIRWARVSKTPEARPIFWARTFCFVKKKKPLDLQVFSRIGKTMKKLQRIPKPIANTSLLVIFCLWMVICLMTSKLIHLLMTWGTFNWWPVLEQGRGVIRAIKYLRWSVLQKYLTRWFKNVNYYCKKVHFRCFTGFAMCLSRRIKHCEGVYF